MQFVEQLENDSILIIPKNLKTKVLVYLNDNNIIKSLKILTFNDLKKGLFFDYGSDATKETMDYLQVSLDVAKNYLNNLYYITEEKYDNDKLNMLLDLKKHLLNKNLLIQDNLFKYLLKSKKKVYVYGFDYINRFNMYILDKVKELVDVLIIEKDYKEYSHTVYEFKSMFDEVSFVFESIFDLIKKGIPLNKIYIANYSDEYYFCFKTLMKITELPIYLKSTTTLYTTPIGNYFLENLSNNIDSLINKIKRIFKNESDEVVINQLTNLLNNYYWCNKDYVSIKTLIENDMRSKIVPNRHYEEEVTTTSIIDNMFNDDEYVFMIGFNLGSVPRLKKDEDFINDELKPSFLETTDIFNKSSKETLIKAIKNIKNLTITYKLGTPFKSYEKSFLISDLGFDVKRIDFQVSNYFNDLNKLNMTKSIDSLIKFNEQESKLALLYNNYECKYKTYDNSFGGIDINLLRDKINDKIVFSYSNISDYYKCPFRFYVNNILNIKTFETKLAQVIGNIFHYVLEKSLEKELDIDSLIDDYLREHKDEFNMNYKDKYFIYSLRKEIKFVVETIKEQQSHSSHTKTLYEKEITLDIDRKIKTKIKGFVDKILVLDNAVLIIDYKTTNSQTINNKLFEFGLSTQLPIYLYLLNALDNKTEVAGIYVQHILDLDEKYEPNKDVLNERKKKLRLEGITFNDINLISKFDDTYEKSTIIKSLSLTKDGEMKKNKGIMSLEERNNLIDLMENLIIKCIDNVSDGIFNVSPIKIDKIADGCEFCEYKDVCYRKFKDFNIQILSTKEGDDDE